MNCECQLERKPRPTPQSTAQTHEVNQIMEHDSENSLLNPAPKPNTADAASPDYFLFRHHALFVGNRIQEADKNRLVYSHLNVHYY